ncbi:MAG: hypothetical protein QOF65_2887 [Thermoleophilaceae bacterium]|nr:hypothetical protein [Thermoleophilaceae bacterium]
MPLTSGFSALKRLRQHSWGAYDQPTMTTGQKIPTQAPLRSLDQRMEALRRANAVRVERARLKRELKAGDVSAREVLTRPPEYLMTAKVFDVLLSLPKFGRVKATRCLNQCRISQSKTVGGLSERQRDELVALLGAR